MTSEQWAFPFDSLRPFRSTAMAASTRRRVQFRVPREVEVIREDLDPPASDEVQVRTEYSAISPGTERLVYEGNAPRHLDTDASIEALKDGTFSYPLSYGYACVGTVERVGTAVGEEWEGARVFGFQPHASRFVASPESLVRLPTEAKMTDAVLIPSVETAVNFIMDGRPVIGERIVVFGLGVVGLLTTRLLANYPVSSIVTVDLLASRRQSSLDMGATESVPDVRDANLDAEMKRNSSSKESPEPSSRRADLVYELTGDPSILNDAIELTGFGGRLVVGSWYGTKSAPLNLGGHFHRSRMRIVSSQVSTIAPEHRGRWTKSRRMSVVLELLPEITPGRLISHRYDVEDAPAVYDKLSAKQPMLQPVFVYE